MALLHAVDVGHLLQRVEGDWERELKWQGQIRK